MAKIALKDSTIKETTASNHITYRKYEQTGTGGGGCNSWDENGVCTGYSSTYPIMGWVGGYTTSAKVKGKAVSTVTNVSIEGKAPIVKGDKTLESDTYTIPNGEYVSGSHTNAQGSITGGNSNNVYANGKLIAIKGSTITTHASTSSEIDGELSSTVNIGS